MAVITMIIIALVALAAVLIFIALGLTVARKRTDRRRVEARDIHQAQTRRSDAATARDAVNQEYRRAETMDPESPRGTAVDTQDPRVMPRSG
jgi:Flp pilus assembly protein TadB